MKSEPPPIPPVIQTGQSIRYELARSDIFFSSLTIFLRNRLLQLFILGLLVFNGWLQLSPAFNERTVGENIAQALAFIVVFCGVLLLVQTGWAAIAAFLQKHPGVVGEHILEITDVGLIECTAANETLHKWQGINRILLGSYNLYIYTGSENFHMVPKRCFSREEIAAFEKEIRSRAHLK